jgi:hypothetical protein
MKQSLISCSTCGRRNRKSDKCNLPNELYFYCDESNNYKFWRPSLKLMNQLNKLIQLQQDLKLYKKAFEIICESKGCPPYDYYSECLSQLNCKECCEKYALDEAKKQLKKEGEII